MKIAAGIAVGVEPGIDAAREAGGRNHRSRTDIARRIDARIVADLTSKETNVVAVSV